MNKRMNTIYSIVILSLIPTISFADNVVYETDWVSSDEMESILSEMDTNRLFPCHVEGALRGIKIVYKGAYCPYPQNLDHFDSRWGLSDSWYERYSKEYVDSGHYEYFHSTFYDLSGNSVHQATWILPSK